jgi:hypothetical protein
MATLGRFYRVFHKIRILDAGRVVPFFVSKMIMTSGKHGERLLGVPLNYQFTEWVIHEQVDFRK